MKHKLLAGALSLLLLCGCAEVLGPVKEAAGLSKAASSSAVPSSSRQSRAPRAPSTPESSFPSYPDPRDSEPSVPPPPEGDAEAEPVVYYNGYLGLRVTIPPECYSYDGDLWYLEDLNDLVLTGDPEESMDPGQYDWMEEERGETVSLLYIECYAGEDYESAWYSLIVDNYPEMGNQEYLDYLQEYLEQDTDYYLYEVTLREAATLGGTEATRFLVTATGIDDDTDIEVMEYYVVPRNGMQVLSIAGYSPEIPAAAEAARRMLDDICGFTALGRGI